jgi:hypothetical protein
MFTIAAALAGGSKCTVEFAKKHAKPGLHLSERGSYESAAGEGELSAGRWAWGLPRWQDARVVARARFTNL